MREVLLMRVMALATRLAQLGVGPDVAAMSLADLWGLYWFLSRAAQEA